MASVNGFTKPRLIALALALVLLPVMVQAAVPSSINYQGRLTDGDDAGLDGTFTITFRIYTAATGGSMLWQETHPGVTVESGLFSVKLGASTPLELSLFQSGQLWLGIAVGTDPEMTPRIELVAVPYARAAAYADNAAVGGGWTDNGSVVNLTFEDAKVGIGKSNPDGKLHTYSSTGTAVIGETDNGWGVYGLTYDGDAVHASVGGTGKAIVMERAGGPYGFLVGPDTGLYINSASGVAGYFGGNVRITGNLGMGTNNPEAKIHAYSASGSGIIGATDNAWGLYGVAFGSGDALHASASGSGKCIVMERPGGPNGYFGAPDTALYIDAGSALAGYFDGNIRITGNLGMGSNNPEAKIHAYNATGSGVIGATDNAWGLYGVAFGTGDALHASVSGSGKCIVMERPGGPNGYFGAPDTALYIDAGSALAGYFDGSVRIADTLGVGTDDPRDNLEVRGAIRVDGGSGNAAMLRFAEGGAKKWAFLYRPWAAGKLGLWDEVGAKWTMAFVPSTGQVGIGTDSPNYTLDVRGNIGNNTTLYHSDRRWKKDIRRLDKALDKVTQLRGVSFRWRQDEFADMNFPAGTQVGLVAQEVEEVLPELVKTGADGYKSVEYANLVAVLVEAVKEQQATIGRLAERIDKLEKLRLSHNSSQGHESGSMALTEK